VGGEVVNSGLVSLTPGMNPVQAVIGSGGFKETAKLSETIVIRKGPDDRPIPIRLDLEKVIYGNNPERDFRLQPYDIVYVPKTAIAKANLFVRQYIQELFLFRGFSFGFVYRLDDKVSID
jgi:protein involved in polysaccharide export with SLBB domain